MKDDLEFYETPDPFTRWLFRYMAGRQRIHGRVFEPCVGDGAIVRAARGADDEPGISWERAWVTNDLDTRWRADHHSDARSRSVWVDVGAVEFTVSNPPFSGAIDIITHALDWSTIGVAMHLRASIHEVLKTGVRRTWMSEHPPTGILWLPRFAYQRSKTKGTWTTDTVCACWCVWLRNSSPQFIDYAPESVIDELEAFTPAYRDRMDRLMGYTGSEAERQEQRIAA